MIKILYVVSTLRRTGPGNQLSYIVKHLDRSRFEPHILTLSSEPPDSKWKDFETLGIPLHSLNLSRIGGLLFAKKRVRRHIRDIQPDIVQTHGIRADGILASLSMSMNIPWMLTIRNYPYEDNVMLHGRLAGTLAAAYHVRSMKKCRHVVACGKTVAQRLQPLGIDAFPIQNGVEFAMPPQTATDPPNATTYSALDGKHAKPVFLSSGRTLEKRKNNAFTIRAFNRYKAEGGAGSLILLGDGSEGPMFRALAAEGGTVGTPTNGSGSDVHFPGQVTNVSDYYRISDYFISAALSEGLPNSVLEALFWGLPVLLSDIPSHTEIARENPSVCKTFPLDENVDVLADLMKNAKTLFPENTGRIAREFIRERFSASAMSLKYQNYSLKNVAAGFPRASHLSQPNV